MKKIIVVLLTITMLVSLSSHSFCDDIEAVEADKNNDSDYTMTEEEIIAFFDKIYPPLYYNYNEETGLPMALGAVHCVVESKYPDCMRDPEYYMFNGYQCFGIYILCDEWNEITLGGALGLGNLIYAFDPKYENEIDKHLRGIENLEQLKEYRKKYYDNIEYLIWYCAMSDVGGGSAMPAGTGDVNNDYSFNSRDAALLMRHLASWDVSAQNFKEKYADMNQDGAVNSRDVAIMLRIQAGWHNAE